MSAKRVQKYKESLKLPGNDDKLSAFKQTNRERSSKFYMRMKDDQEYRKRKAEKEKLRHQKKTIEKFASQTHFNRNIFLKGLFPKRFNLSLPANNKGQQFYRKLGKNLTSISLSLKSLKAFLKSMTERHLLRNFTI